MLLALETSSRAGSVALGPAGGPYDFVPLPNGRSEELASAVAALIGDGAAGLTHYAIGIGPGSFTGLRVGLCFLKGFGLAFPRPVVAVSSFRIVAEQVFAARPELSSVLVVLDARNGERLAGRYLAKGAELWPDPDLPDALYTADVLMELISPRCGKDDLVAGEGAALLADALQAADPDLAVPRADTLAMLASRDLSRGGARELLGLEPAYLQKPTAERRRTQASD